MRFRPRFEKQGYRFVRCATCTLVRLDPLPEQEALTAFYDESYRSGAYATFASAEAVRMATATARLAMVRPFVPPGPWLDVGCSTGSSLRAAAAHGIDAEGIELSSAAVAAARAAGLRVERIAAEDFRPERPYACVTAFDLLEHLLEPGALLARLRDWLVPGGCLAVSVPDTRSLAARAMGRHWYFYAPPVHVQYFDRRSLARLLVRHGFAVRRIVAAPKVITLDYAVSVLGAFDARLHRVARVLTAPLPGALRRRLVRLPVGEIMAVATPG
ncbi:MAG TPA: class I SAM-dependent methyltransferase [Candidatus Limnocylindria bacterium]|nr:class I SAM-dependent methyltransferase [Candidatus Limnocylindria bacterium]